jgi:uncharacterized protein YgbK (DUF1537 family)
VRDANIARRLAEGSRRKAGQLTLDQVRSGPEGLKSAVHSLLVAGIELIVADIDEQEDLRRLCLGLSQSNLRIVWVGSTGMAEFVALAFGVASPSDTLGRNYSLDPRPALALVGSASETTGEQLRYAQTNGELKMIHLDPVQMIQNDSTAAAELEHAYFNLQAVVESGYDAALVVRASRDEITATQELGATLNLSAAQVAQKIVDGLAKVGSRVVSEGRISGIVATGGDTANAFCNTLDAHALEILGEVEAGIPIMRLLGARSLPMVTKAGGFGSPAAMADALAKVKQYA